MSWLNLVSFGLELSKGLVSTLLTTKTKNTHETYKHCKHEEKKESTESSKINNKLEKVLNLLRNQKEERLREKIESMRYKMEKKERKRNERQTFYTQLLMLTLMLIPIYSQFFSTSKVTHTDQLDMTSHRTVAVPMITNDNAQEKATMDKRQQLNSHMNDKYYRSTETVHQNGAAYSVPNSAITEETAEDDMNGKNYRSTERANRNEAHSVPNNAKKEKTAKDGDWVGKENNRYKNNVKHSRGITDRKQPRKTEVEEQRNCWWRQKQRANNLLYTRWPSMKVLQPVERERSSDGSVFYVFTMKHGESVMVTSPGNSGIYDSRSEMTVELSSNSYNSFLVECNDGLHVFPDDFQIEVENLGDLQSLEMLQFRERVWQGSLMDPSSTWISVGYDVFAEGYQPIRVDVLHMNYDELEQRAVFSVHRLARGVPGVRHTGPWVSVFDDEEELVKMYSQMWHRGHLAPDADFIPSLKQLTYYYQNAAPQLASLNRGPWRNLEKKIRISHTDAVIITGTSAGNQTAFGLHGVYFPDSWLEDSRISNFFWKIVITENQQLGYVFLNRQEQEVLNSLQTFRCKDASLASGFCFHGNELLEELRFWIPEARVLIEEISLKRNATIDHIWDHFSRHQ